MYEMGAGAPRFLYDLVRRTGIECSLVQTGTYRLAHSTASLRVQHEAAETLAAEGAPVRMLDPAATEREVGAHGYRGGYIDARGGNLQPLDFVRGLVGAAQARGAIIHADSRVVALDAVGGGWRARTRRGAVRAQTALIATNAYTDTLWPGLAETLLAVQSFQVATAPLDAARLGSILPGGQAAYDSRRLVLYFRRSPDGRVVLGGRASFTLARRTADYRMLQRVLVGIFPSLHSVPIAYRWAGRVAITRDFVPHLHEPAPGVFIALGYNGRGIALATRMGAVLADLACGRRDVSYPITPLERIPWHRLHPPALHAAMRYQALMDFFGY
jgi:glycine/D-amino acid oxidase-like deaminating enzyme